MSKYHITAQVGNEYFSDYVYVDEAWMAHKIGFEWFRSAARVEYVGEMA